LPGLPLGLTHDLQLGPLRDLSIDPMRGLPLDPTHDPMRDLPLAPTPDASGRARLRMRTDKSREPHAIHRRAPRPPRRRPIRRCVSRSA
jgi:hypothetical protein